MSVRIVIASALLAATASAKTLHNGRVYETTADRIIQRERLACAYGPWQYQTLPDGTTVVSRSMVCAGESRKR